MVDQSYLLLAQPRVAAAWGSDGVAAGMVREQPPRWLGHVRPPLRVGDVPAQGRIWLAASSMCRHRSNQDALGTARAASSMTILAFPPAASPADAYRACFGCDAGTRPVTLPKCGCANGNTVLPPVSSRQSRAGCRPQPGSLMRNVAGTRGQCPGRCACAGLRRWPLWHARQRWRGGGPEARAASWHTAAAPTLRQRRQQAPARLRRRSRAARFRDWARGDGGGARACRAEPSRSGLREERPVRQAARVRRETSPSRRHAPRPRRSLGRQGQLCRPKRLRSLCHQLLRARQGAPGQQPGRLLRSLRLAHHEVGGWAGKSSYYALFPLNQIHSGAGGNFQQDASKQGPRQPSNR